MNHKKISDAAIRRLPRYYRHLKEMEREGILRTSSQALSQRMGLTASQIRQDFNHFGGFGQQGYGYKVKELCDALAKILGQGQNRFYNTIIIGAGNMGRALGRYDAFRQEGIRVMAYFDQDPTLVDHMIEGLYVYPMEQLEWYIRQNEVEIAVITVPSFAAQAVASRVIAAGVKGIWNFAPVDLKANGVTIESIHLTDSMLALTYRMNEQQNLEREVRGRAAAETQEDART